MAQRREPRPADEIDELTAVLSDGRVDDDQLALILLCCHPALNHEAQVALTLRVVAGLTTDQIARGFMVDSATMAQRLVRAKHKIRRAGIPFGVPDADRLDARLDAAMQVVYLVFNEGYASTQDDSFIRHDLCGEAIRLGRLLASLVPEQPEVLGLLALMLLHDARAPGRVDASGEIVTLQRQDRSRWRHDQIDEGLGLVDRAMAMHRAGRYQIEAAIAALHSSAPTAEDTDWHQIDLLYRTLLRHVPTPVVALNGAVARSMAEGPVAGLAMIDALVADGRLERWYLLHSTRAELLRRAGFEDDARVELERAVALAPSTAERQLLTRRLGDHERGTFGP
jgi:RNA polymerase sigma-70 factor (ECF subfamily)